MINSPTSTIFYSIEKAIKEYRKYSQKNIAKRFDKITVDQALLMQFIDNHPELSQSQIADRIFKDNASVTRMIELMVKRNEIERKSDENDRRKQRILLTDKGSKYLTELHKIITSNRSHALKGISENEISQLNNILLKIIDNCNKN